MWSNVQKLWHKKCFVNSDLMLAVSSRCMEAAADCMRASDFRDSKDSAFRRSLSQRVNLGWLSVVPTLPVCLEPRGDGFGASLGTVCTFPTSQGRWWGFARNQRVGFASHKPSFARLTRGKSAKSSCAHAWHSALRIAANGQPGDKWQHPGNGHA
jgi:hypothetical protein